MNYIAPRELNHYSEIYRRRPGYFTFLVKMLAGRLPRHPARKLHFLDIGCGFGDFLATCQKFLGNHDYHGLTLSVSEHDHVKHHHRYIHINLGNQKKICFFYGRHPRFDLVVNYHTLSYVNQTNQLRVLKQITAILAKNGLLLLGTIDGWLKKTDRLRQSGPGYLQYYYKPQLFWYLYRHYRLLESFIEQHNYRVQLWQKREQEVQPSPKESLIFCWYIAKSIFIR